LENTLGPDRGHRFFRTPSPRRLRRPGRAAAFLLALPLAGCLYTTHHFNSGRLLEPGETAVTFGMGKAYFYEEACPDGYRDYVPAHGAEPRCRSEKSLYGGIVEDTAGGAAAADSIRPMGLRKSTSFKGSLGYRLGVRKRWGPLTGIEMGWSVEAPTNPMTLEFDVKAGLPLPARWQAAHSLSAGWGIGAWVDNSWFVEYAASRAFGDDAVFLNYRYTRVATQPEDLDSSFDAGRFVPLPGSAHQWAVGWYHKLPAIPLIPDHLVPEVTATLPVYLYGARVPAAARPAVDFNFNLGMGWDF
jgi:hypothetical protein